MSTRNRATQCTPFSGSVLAAIARKSATVPLLMNILVPLSTYPLPVLTALVMELRMIYLISLNLANRGFQVEAFRLEAKYSRPSPTKRDSIEANNMLNFVNDRNSGSLNAKSAMNIDMVNPVPQRIAQQYS